MEKVLEFGSSRVKPDVRRLSDMREVIYDIEWLKGAPDMELYYMYRDLAVSKGDRSIILDHRLRYDITVIPPNRLGAEYVKTAGHYHPLIEGTSYTYPEVYEVLRGTAHYLLQKCEGGRITDVVMIEAKEGDKAIIPPGYGHVTINPSNRELKMANWVSRDFSSIYEPYKKCGGAAYFELVDGRLIRNGRCDHIPDIRFLKPTNIAKLGLSKGKEMYGLVRDIEKLAYLNRPQDYGWLWEAALSDKNRAVR
ncbi:glucose-6-phosphate isomerase family protein [Methanocella conradii]|uniref:glucose-6-phosphate isomerase family protein n=1 Tax=Methanocella conradii TaxID=1175444 RepID=UPI00157CD17C|nr:glucose-6-phosphate isomerase family protein [Methanocella conradii]